MHADGRRVDWPPPDANNAKSIEAAATNGTNGVKASDASTSKVVKTVKTKKGFESKVYHNSAEVHPTSGVIKSNHKLQADPLESEGALVGYF